MNERIRELIKQSGLDYDELWTKDQLAVDKFAELIVRECAEIVANSSLPDTYSEPALEIIAEEIKEHFGVSND